MVASASFLRKAGVGSDSKGGGEERRRRTKEIDEKLSNNGIDNGTKDEENVMEDEVSEDSTEKIYVRAIVMVDRLNKALKVRLNILFDQEQLVTEEEDDEREDSAKKILPSWIKKQTIRMIYIRQ